MKLIRKIAAWWYGRKCARIVAALERAGVTGAPGKYAGTQWTPHGIASIAVVASFPRRVHLIDLGRGMAHDVRAALDPTEAPASTGPNTGQHPTEPPSQISTVTLRGTTP